MKEKALKYFNGNNALTIGLFCSLILSFVCASIYPFIILVSYGSAIDFLLKVWIYVLVVAAIGIWLGFKDRIILSLLLGSVVLSLIEMICLIIYYKKEGCLYSYVLMDLLMSFATSLSIAGAVLIVWLRRNRYRKYYKPLFITGLALSCILNWQDWWDLSLYFLLAAAILLWLPLDKSVCCRECGFRNVKTSRFCGGCGGKLK